MGKVASSEHQHAGTKHVVLALSLCGLLVPSQLYVSITLTAPISSTFEVSPEMALWIGSAFGFAYAVGFVVFGPLSDRYGRKRVLVSGLLALAFSTLGVAASPSFGVMIALRCVQGLSAATFVPAALAYVGETLPRNARTTGLAYVTTGLIASGIFGQVYAEAISDIWGWRWVFWLAVPAFLMFAFILSRQLSRTAGMNRGVSLVGVYRGMGRLFSRRPLIVIFTVSVTVFGSFVAMYTALGPHLEHVHGLRDNYVLLVRLVGLPGMLVAPFVSQLAARWSPRPLVVGGFAASAIGLIVEATTSSVAILVAGSMLFVAGIATVAPSLVALLLSFADDARGAAVSVNNFALFFGASLGPFLHRLLDFTGVCLVLAAVLLIAAATVRMGVPMSLRARAGLRTRPRHRVPPAQ
jgi:YNFM family putative membrane transporter